MDYEEIEEKRYESFWKSMKGELSEDLENYNSKFPSPEAIDFLNFLKKRNIRGNALDVGCGNGRNAVLFAKNNFNAYGIDISKSAIELAKKNARINKVKANFDVSSVFNLKKKNFFDVIIDFGCLHHLRKSQWKKYKKSISESLKKGGYYCLYCFSRNTPYIPKFSPKSKNRDWYLRKNHYNHFFTDKELKDFFKKDFIIEKSYESRKGDSQLLFQVFYMKKR